MQSFAGYPISISILPDDDDHDDDDWIANEILYISLNK